MVNFHSAVPASAEAAFLTADYQRTGKCNLHINYFHLWRDSFRSFRSLSECLSDFETTTSPRIATALHIRDSYVNTTNITKSKCFKSDIWNRH